MAFLRGVSWSSLAPLFGVLFGLTVGLGYAVGRVALNRFLSLLVAVLLLFSGANISVLPLLRDYSKAPFFLATFLLVGVVVHRLMRPLGIIVLSAAAGFVIGIGIGFRADVLVCLPAFIFAAAVFLPGDLRSTIRVRLLIPVVAIAAFAIPATPILGAMTRAGANAHVSLLGMTSPFDATLDIETPFYQWGYRYNDTHINALLNMYSNWTAGNTRPMQVYSPEYERVGRAYLLLIARHFPADMITRVYGAILRNLQLPVNGVPNHLYLDPNHQPLGLSPPRLEHYLQVHAILIGMGDGTVLLAIAAMLILAARSLRYALCLAFIIAYFGAYTVLQFSLRHIFHLEIIALWVTAFVVQAAIRSIRDWTAARHGHATASVDWRRSLWFGLALLIIPAAVLFAARSYQRGHLRQLLGQYGVAEKEPLPYTIEQTSAVDRVLLRPTTAGVAVDQQQGTMRCDYIAIEVREDHPYTTIVFRMKPLGAPQWEQSRTQTIQTPARLDETYPSDSTWILFPAYSGPESVFEGVEVHKDVLPSFRGIYRIRPSPKLPLLLWATLRPRWEDLDPAQRLIGVEQRDTYYAFPDTDGRVRNRRPDFVFTKSDMVYLGPAVTINQNVISVDGPVDRNNADFVHFRPYEAKRGATAIVDGSLCYGALAVLVMKQGQYLEVYVPQPGDFRAAVSVPDDGNYSIILANTTAQGPTRLTVNRVGWIETGHSKQ